MGQPLLQPDCNANLFIDVLRSCVADGRLELNDFVVMPDHVHLLITLRKGMTIERAMHLIKGGFSCRLRKEVGYAGEIWQPGFSEKRAPNGEAYLRYKGYIARNPVKAGLCSSCEEYPHSFEYLVKRVRD